YSRSIIAGHPLRFCILLMVSYNRSQHFSDRLLGYKSPIEIPREIKRRFYRLSGLLELADDEFTNLKVEIEEYSNSLKNQEIAMNEEIFIDSISLNEYISTSSTIKEIDEIIANLLSHVLVDKRQASESIEGLLYFNINKIYELDKAVEENKDEIIFFAKEWVKIPHFPRVISETDVAPEIERGISLLYLGYVLIGKTMDFDQIFHYLNKMAIGSYRKNLATDIINIHNKYIATHKK
ncbi:hypothetical protein, partial [Methanosarcina acetivorans]